MMRGNSPLLSLLLLAVACRARQLELMAKQVHAGPVLIKSVKDALTNDNPVAGQPYPYPEWGPPSDGSPSPEKPKLPFTSGASVGLLSVAYDLSCNVGGRDEHPPWSLRCSEPKDAPGGGAVAKALLVIGKNFMTQEITDGGTVYLKSQRENKFCSVGAPADGSYVTCHMLHYDQNSEFVVWLAGTDGTSVRMHPAGFPDAWCHPMPDRSGDKHHDPAETLHAVRCGGSPPYELTVFTVTADASGGGGYWPPGSGGDSGGGGYWPGPGGGGDSGKGGQPSGGDSGGGYWPGPGGGGDGGKGGGYPGGGGSYPGGGDWPPGGADSRGRGEGGDDWMPSKDDGAGKGAGDYPDGSDYPGAPGSKGSGTDYPSGGAEQADDWSKGEGGGHPYPAGGGEYPDGGGDGKYPGGGGGKYPSGGGDYPTGGGGWAQAH